MQQLLELIRYPRDEPSTPVARVSACSSSRAGASRSATMRSAKGRAIPTMSTSGSSARITPSSDAAALIKIVYSGASLMRKRAAAAANSCASAPESRASSDPTESCSPRMRVISALARRG